MNKNKKMSLNELKEIFRTSARSDHPGRKSPEHYFTRGAGSLPHCNRDCRNAMGKKAK